MRIDESCWIGYYPYCIICEASPVKVGTQLDLCIRKLFAHHHPLLLLGVYATGGGVGVFQGMLLGRVGLCSVVMCCWGYLLDSGYYYY